LQNGQESSAYRYFRWDFHWEATETAQIWSCNSLKDLEIRRIAKIDSSRVAELAPANCRGDLIFPGLPGSCRFFIMVRALKRDLWCVCLVWIACLLAGDVPTAFSQGRPRGAKRAAPIESFQKEHAELRKKFTDSLESLARVCADEKGLVEAAQWIRELARPVETTEVRLAPLPRKTVPPLHPEISADERFWREQLRRRQQDYAKELFLLSRRAVLAEHVNYALDLIHEVLLQDGDHLKARNILGYVRSGDEWMSAFDAQMRKDKKVWTDEFGWIREDHVDRYRQGQRYYDKHWVSKDKADQEHSQFKNAWEVKTEHYVVRTNHSLEKGAALAKKLEAFHDSFFQIMGGFFNNGADVIALIDGTNAKPRNRKGQQNVVHFYRTRDEYLATLSKLTNQDVEITRGMYFPDSRIAHFYFDPQNGNDGTVYHEATHQLLTGSRPMTGDVGVKSDFWIIEGIACYMESFHSDGDGFVVGDPAHGRVQAAREHFVEDRYYVPFRELTKMGMQTYQSIKQPEIARNYSQAAALTHFFMHYDDGRYREALIEYLSQIYSPVAAVRNRPDSLAELAGLTDDQVDRQYADYIRRLVPVTRPTPPSRPNVPR
jgi:hypothetical protein